MGKRLLIHISLILLFSISGNIKAQKVFVTTNGAIQITGVWNDSAIVALSNKVVIRLNYETAEFEIRLDKSTLRTGIDSLDNELNKLKWDILVYEGKLGIDYIMTQKHPPLDFEIEGYLSCSIHDETIVGSGHLEHIFGDIYSCMLNMDFEISLKDINLNIDLPGLSNDISVKILQAVLKRENE